MGLKEYEVRSATGTTTVQLSDEDAEARGLKGGSSVEEAQEFSATGEPGAVPEPEASPDTPDVAAQREAAEAEPSKREKAASKAFGAKNK